jgi:tetratricopeptide (TPR) repeat protein
VAVGVLAYLNSFNNPFLFDDYFNIVYNPRIRDLGDCCRRLLSERRSVTTLSLALNYSLGGFHVRGYHAVNLLVHLLAGLALYGLVRRVLLLPLLAGQLGSVAAELALAVALLWLVHPLQTESVTYLAHRGEALAGLFTLLALLCLLRGATGGRPRAWYVLAALACALAMKSKEIAVTAPVLALLFDRTFLAASWREALCRRFPLHLGLMATWALLSPELTSALANAPWVAAAHGAGRAVDPEDYPAAGPIRPEGDAAVPTAGFGLRGITPLDYARSQPGVILHYLRLAVWPDALCVDYGWPVARTPAQMVTPAAIVVLLLLLTTAWAWLRCRPFGFLGACFFLLLAPTSSILPIADLAAERRMYLPLAPVVVLAVVGGHLGLEALARRHRLSLSLLYRLQIGAVLFAALILAWLTFQRNRVYQRELVLWSDVTTKAPGNARGHYNLGMALANLGNLDAAEPCYLTALEINPEQPLACARLGQIYLARKQPGEAAQYFARELQLSPRNTSVLNNLGTALALLGKYDDAIHCYRRALQINGTSAQAHSGLGLVLLLQNNPDEAIPHLQQASRLDSRDDRAVGHLGRVLLVRGQARMAAECLRKALDLKPGSARYRHDLDRALAQARAEERHRKRP